MDEFKPKFRKPDGSPEPRSVDDVLREAIRSGEFDNLPGKGRPLDLEGYFSTDPENRVAHRLLKDNAALPAPLQDRKEAEALRQAVETLRIREEKALREAQEEIRRTSLPLGALFSDRQTVIDHLGLPAWPSCFAEPGEGTPPDLREALRVTDRLGSLIARHNGRAEAFVGRYADLIEQANACIRRLNNRLASTGRLTAGFQMMAPVDAPVRVGEFREGFPPLPTLSEDAPMRIRKYFEKKRFKILQYILQQWFK